jgi:hypothetical protein
MKVKDYLDTFKLEHDVAEYDDSVFLKYINLCEANLDIIKSYTVKYYNRVLNEFQYALPAGVTVEDIRSVHVNGRKYKKKDVRAHKELYSYWIEDGVLCIYPACTESDLSYVSEENEITFDTNKITTAGAEFAFSVGDTILISGCTVNESNNKYATIVGVSGDELTFADGTFTTGAETAAITITRPKIKMVYESRPETKLIANITTDDLVLPDRFIDIYDYYIMSKINYLQKEYTAYKNDLIMFNTRVAEFEAWYSNNRPQMPETEIVAEEEW